MNQEKVPNCPMDMSVSDIEMINKCTGIPGYEICLLCQHIGESQGNYAPMSTLLMEQFGRGMSSPEKIANWKVRKEALLTT